MDGVESHLQLLPLQTETVDFAVEVLQAKNAMQVCKSQIPFKLCHVAQGLEMRTLDFLILSSERPLH